VKLRTAVMRLISRADACAFAAGREPKDFDVATSATPDVVLRMFDRTFSVGAHFGCSGSHLRGADAAARQRVPWKMNSILLRRWRHFDRMGLIRMGGIRMQCAIR